MKYLNENDIKDIGIDWNTIINTIEDAVKSLDDGDFVQPIKPYLRYRDFKNRIIAMPSFLGGNFNISGIKWIASFPDNVQKGIPRAHSVVILNNANTGEPLAVINTALLSILRTAAVSGLMMRYYDRFRELNKFNLGIIGWGPIGQYHFKLFTELYKDRLNKIFIYDNKLNIDKNNIDFGDKEKIVITDNWQSAYEDSDVFITCTVSDDRYIDSKPKKGSLQLNVSLRDYKVSIFDYVQDAIVVDDWDEVCRESTDIEMMHKERNLMAEDVKTIVDVVCHKYLESVNRDQVVMFNPMGMGIFDMAIGSYYLQKSNSLKIGTDLK